MRAIILLAICLLAGQSYAKISTCEVMKQSAIFLADTGIKTIETCLKESLVNGHGILGMGMDYATNKVIGVVNKVIGKMCGRRRRMGYWSSFEKWVEKEGCQTSIGMICSGLTKAMLTGMESEFAMVGLVPPVTTCLNAGIANYVRLQCIKVCPKRRALRNYSYGY